MKHLFTCLLLGIILNISSSLAQNKYTFSGSVFDERNNESLIGVNIIIPELKTGTTTNEYGFFSITLPEGEYDIIISYLGYTDIFESLNLSENIVKNYKLSEAL